MYTISLIVVIAGLFLLAVGYIISTYNTLISLNNNVKKAWSNISVLLKQRHDEIPKLVQTCKQYIKYEPAAFNKIVNARKQVEQARKLDDITQVGKAHLALHDAVNGLIALAENYPELKANDSFRQLQERISEIESQIADRQELYNESVNISNIRIHQFPISIIATLFRFKEGELLQFPAELISDVNISKLFQED